MNYGYVEVVISLEFWAEQSIRVALRRELRRSAKMTLLAERMPTSPIVWRLELDDRHPRMILRGFVGVDRVLASDIVRNRRRWPELSRGAPCWACGLPGLRMARMPSLPTVAALLPGDDPLPMSLTTIDACPRHRGPVLRLAARYRRDPAIRG